MNIFLIYFNFLAWNPLEQPLYPRELSQQKQCVHTSTP